MLTQIRIQLRVVSLLSMLVIPILWGTPARGSDHGDTPLLKEIARHDARLTDLYAFVRDDNLVVIVCLDPAVPADVTGYQFASDLTVNVFIDKDSKVTFNDPVDLSSFGGTIVNPRKIKEDIVFRVRFDEKGSPKLHTRGLSRSVRQNVSLFAGLRDDPFIRGPRVGRNIAAIVLQLPLEDVLTDHDTLIIWATSKVEDIKGPFQDMVGRALRSQFLENDLMNVSSPRQHHKKMGVRPDVMIFDTSHIATFPNGRELTDDVVDLVGDSRVLANDDPFPDQNDLAFLNEFPYLAPPHPPSK